MISYSNKPLKFTTKKITFILNSYKSDLNLMYKCIKEERESAVCCKPSLSDGTLAPRP